MARARRFARDLRLQLMCEHPGRATHEDTDLLDPDVAINARQASANVFDDWYRSGCATPRPPPHTSAATGLTMAPTAGALGVQLRLRPRRPPAPRETAAHLLTTWHRGGRTAMPSRCIVGVPEHVHRELEAGQISGRAVVVPQDCPSAPDRETGRHVRWTPRRRCF